MPFQVGQSGNPAGRPKGIVTKKWSNIGYWHDLIEKNMDKLTPREKVRLGQWGMSILIDKSKTIDNPEESKQNVESTLEMLKQMESKGTK